MPGPSPFAAGLALFLLALFLQNLPSFRSSDFPCEAYFAAYTGNMRDTQYPLRTPPFDNGVQFFHTLTTIHQGDGIMQAGALNRMRRWRSGRVLAGLAVVGMVGMLGGMFSACSASLSRPQGRGGVTVFFNSFEEPGDTLSWYWVGSPTLAGDVPPGGGAHSLKVLSTGLFPAASFLTRPLRRGGAFVLECWGKSEGTGGYVELTVVRNHEPGDAIQAAIVEPQWRQVASADTLYCPPGSSLMLSIQAGSLMRGSILVDMIRIRRVGPYRQLAARF
ncbi:MAG: hypothetical protein D6681_22045 [Calditrichaeota bacterium]|nr:MAG: hypothetical protein D6681_22045 [Calditrichota bacterium]